ncbi:MAG: efflux RND transporter periplasmic adaptor subunit [Planctomycetaceae bacterium]
MSSAWRWLCNALWSFVVAVTTLSFATTPSFSQAQEVKPETVAVRAVAVVRQQVTRTTTQPATIEPYYQAEIRSRLAEYVLEVKVDIGDVVRKDDVLATLDIPEMSKQAEIIQARIRRLRAEEQSAAAGIAMAEASIKSALALLEQAKSQVAMDDALLKAATAEADRMKDLVSRGASEPRLLDEAVRKRDAANASRQATMSAIASAQANVVVAESKKAAAQASDDVARAETEIAIAELARLKVTMNFAQLKAPFSGIVTERNVNPGDLVSSGNGSHSARPLFVINQIDKVRCHLAIPERDAAFVRRGDRILLRLPSFAGETFETQVTRTNQSLDHETRTMLVEAEIPNPDGKLLPGMFGQATLSLQAPATVSVLPSRAVRFDAKGNARVFLISEDNIVAVREIEILSDDGQMLQVAGVEPGQRVIDAHLQRFVDGQQVRVLSP